MNCRNFVTTNPPFVVEHSPVFAPETLRTLSSTTRFHAPLYPPLNTLTPLKILFFFFFFPYKMNAPHPLPFLQYFNSELYHLPFSVGNFYKSIMLPIRHFLALSSSRSLYLSSIFLASYLILFSSSPHFPYFDFFFRFIVMSRVLLSLLFTLSFLSLISQRHLRSFEAFAHFLPSFPCWFLYSLNMHSR